jgi:hypothetical protein
VRVHQAVDRQIDQRPVCPTPRRSEHELLGRRRPIVGGPQNRRSTTMLTCGLRVRRQGLEPRTRWLRAGLSACRDVPCGAGGCRSRTSPGWGSVAASRTVALAENVIPAGQLVLPVLIRSAHLTGGRSGRMTARAAAAGLPRRDQHLRSAWTDGHEQPGQGREIRYRGTRSQCCKGNSLARERRSLRRDRALLAALLYRLPPQTCADSVSWCALTPWCAGIATCSGRPPC